MNINNNSAASFFTYTQNEFKEQLEKIANSADNTIRVVNHKFDVIDHHTIHGKISMLWLKLMMHCGVDSGLDPIKVDKEILQMLNYGKEKHFFNTEEITDLLKKIQKSLNKQTNECAIKFIDIIIGQSKEYLQFNKTIVNAMEAAQKGASNQLFQSEIRGDGVRVCSNYLDIATIFSNENNLNAREEGLKLIHAYQNYLKHLINKSNFEQFEFLYHQMAAIIIGLETNHSISFTRDPEYKNIKINEQDLSRQFALEMLKEQNYERADHFFSKSLDVSKRKFQHPEYDQWALEYIDFWFEKDEYLQKQGDSKKLESHRYRKFRHLWDPDEIGRLLMLKIAKSRKT